MTFQRSTYLELYEEIEEEELFLSSMHGNASKERATTAASRD
jgi:hypothetical protein